MTSVFMIFEITQDYQILVPLMVATLLSFTISRRYQPTPVYHALLEQDHVHLPTPVQKAGLRGWTARDIMSDAPGLVAPGRSVESLWPDRDATDQRPWLVGAPHALVGVLRPERVAEAIQSGHGSQTVEALADRAFPHAHPDHPIDIVLERLAGSDGLLPILSRDDARRVEGVITIHDVTRVLGRK
jgi:CIC family chloride channel protein